MGMLVYGSTRAGLRGCRHGVPRRLKHRGLPDLYLSEERFKPGLEGRPSLDKEFTF